MDTVVLVALVANREKRKLKAPLKSGATKNGPIEKYLGWSSLLPQHTQLPTTDTVEGCMCGSVLEVVVVLFRIFGQRFRFALSGKLRFIFHRQRRFWEQPENAPKLVGF